MANYTPNYQLHQWEPEDKFLRTDFNQDLSKIDTALDGLADKSAALEAAVALCGNCELWTGSYMGNGTYGENSPNRLTLPAVPVLLFLVGPSTMQMMTPSNGGCAGIDSSNCGACISSWAGSTVTWYSNGGPSWQMNNKKTTYLAIAFYEITA